MLLFNSMLKLFVEKLKSKWSGPFTVVNVSLSGAIELEDHGKRRFTMNTQWLKHLYIGGCRVAKVKALCFKDVWLMKNNVVLWWYPKCFLGGNPSYVFYCFVIFVEWWRYVMGWEYGTHLIKQVRVENYGRSCTKCQESDFSNLPNSLVNHQSPAPKFYFLGYSIMKKNDACHYLVNR